MLYFVLGVIIGLLLLVLWNLKKLLVMVNEIKKYQYINNLKLLGFIKKELFNLYRKGGDKNVK